MRKIGRKGTRAQIAERLRAARKAVSITQADAARLAKISRDTWNRIEAGSQALPAERVIDFAKIVSITPEQLLGIGDA
jgi:transcriptional regulator with XRE-family HTH domain